MSIQNATGDLLSSNCVVRCHQVNCVGVMDAGIAKQVKEKYPEAYLPYRALCKQFGEKLLGEVQFVPCHDGTIIANLFAQADYAGPGPKTQMDAMEACLQRVADFVKRVGASVGFPKMMGAGLAGGNWDTISNLISTYMSELDVTIVDFNGELTDSVGKVEPAAKKQASTKSVSAKMPRVKLYTDGACSGNPGPGGWACILVSELGTEKELCGGSPDTTNNRMEVTAVIKGLEALNKSCEVMVISDSKYVVDAINKGWIKNWKKLGWRKKEGPIKNPDLWKRMDELLSIHKVTFTWTKGHASDEYNNRCDAMASEKAKSFGW